ncbi:N-acetylmuramoyl-L-alanine amidase [Akkermansiaceae bacterium]|nr:N-acetylmuramoyl-L-alanine amidase [Akkermansiaceae bacterium]MDB4142849.1 N-acetylmuramoyl-L-alanine amidase [Akkermansiaceae bacterium]
MKNVNFFKMLVIASFFFGGVTQAAFHTVRSSETFYSIAKKHGVGVDSLMKLNKVSDPRYLKVGQRLSIPSATAFPSRKVVTTKSLRIVMDAGHGGKDKGAYWHGVRESDLNLRVASRVEASLKARGYGVSMTRRSDVFLSLSKRVSIANRYRNAIFVSIHFNATPNTRVHGAETFYAGGKKGYYLASAIQKELVSRLKVTNRGARVARFTVLTQTRCPAVLVECGFISNARERARCTTSTYQSQAAQAIVAGIERYDRVY